MFGRALIAFDTWLIERVFQPIADRLARWVSCYGIALFLLTGMQLALVVYVVLSWNFFAILTSVVWIMPMCELDRWKPGGFGALPRWRLYWGPRLLFIIMSLASVCSCCLLYSVRDLCFALSYVLLTLAVYFMACFPRPPKPRKARASIWGAVQQGV